MGVANPEVNKVNIDALHQYAKETRVLMREVQDQVQAISNENQQLKTTVADLQQQIGILRGVVLGGAATG